MSHANRKIGRPLMNPAVKRVVASYSLPPGLDEWIREAAQDANVSRSRFVTEILRQVRRERGE